MLPDRPGVTLFGNSNVGSVTQMTALTHALQEAAGTDLPLLIAADHEGGQLLGAGPATTPFPGNMALGAADDTDLSEAVGRAMGRELRALGITVDYAPVCDLATHPDNPLARYPRLWRRSGTGGRAGGGDGAWAPVGGGGGGGQALSWQGRRRGRSPLRAARSRPRPERLEEVELVPFRAAVDAGARW